VFGGRVTVDGASKKGGENEEVECASEQAGAGRGIMVHSVGILLFIL
jgi:hypothetical protein